VTDIEDCAASSYYCY